MIITADSYLEFFMCQTQWQIYYMYTLSIIFIKLVLFHLHLDTLSNIKYSHTASKCQRPDLKQRMSTIQPISLTTLLSLPPTL